MGVIELDGFFFFVMNFFSRNLLCVTMTVLGTMFPFLPFLSLGLPLIPITL